LKKGIFISIVVAGAVATTLMLVPTSPSAPAVESHEGHDDHAGHDHEGQTSADPLQAKIDEADRILQEGKEPPMKAIFLLREVLEEDPNHIGATMKLGQLSLISGQYDKAEARFQHAFDIAPETPGVGAGMVQALMGQGKGEEARTFGLEWVKAYPDHPDTTEVQAQLESMK
jgi:predicted Zn-dependent protease